MKNKSRPVSETERQSKRSSREPSDAITPALRNDISDRRKNKNEAPRKSGIHATGRTIADGPYAWLSQASIIRARSAARANGLAVLLAMASKAPIKGGPFKASINNLADLSGLSPRTIHRTLHILAMARVVAIESGQGRGDGGGDTANTFLLLRVKLSNAEGGGSVTDSQGGMSDRQREGAIETCLVGSIKRGISQKANIPLTSPSASSEGAEAPDEPGDGNQRETEGCAGSWND